MPQIDKRKFQLFIFCIVPALLLFFGARMALSGVAERWGAVLTGNVAKATIARRFLSPRPYQHEMWELHTENGLNIESVPLPTESGGTVVQIYVTKSGRPIAAATPMDTASDLLATSLLGTFVAAMSCLFTFFSVVVLAPSWLSIAARRKIMAAGKLSTLLASLSFFLGTASWAFLFYRAGYVLTAAILLVAATHPLMIFALYRYLKAQSEHQKLKAPT